MSVAFYRVCRILPCPLQKIVEIDDGGLLNKNNRLETKTHAEEVFKTVVWGGVDVFVTGLKQVCSVLKTSSPRHPALLQPP
jgi:hypothetical protein